MEDSKGALQVSLAKTGNKLRSDRAEEIAEAIEIAYTRKVQDAHLVVKKIKRSLKSLLDFSPDNTFSIIKLLSIGEGNEIFKN